VVEVSSAKCAGNGHWYLDITERDATGAVLAQARAVIWKSVALSIIPRFTQATGAELVSGVKLLVRARPSFHAQYSFSLHIDAIDPSYTLGELEAKRRQVRARLTAEGIFDANRALPTIWDYNAVLVLAPDLAAGLGDFRKEAERLERHQLCNFVYVHSQFQGEGAPASMLRAINSALERWRKDLGSVPDAIVIIRGGGSATDLAWLDDYALAKFVCTCKAPVLTGIGHERDKTLLDEVAHRSFDTPSKVIVAIEQRICQRASEAKSAFQTLDARARQIAEANRRSAGSAYTNFRDATFRHLQLNQRRTHEFYSEICQRALDGLRRTSAIATSRYTDILAAAQRRTSTMTARLPALLADVHSSANRRLSIAERLSRGILEDIEVAARDTVRSARVTLRRELDGLSVQARAASSDLNRTLPALLTHITLGARHALQSKHSDTQHDLSDVKELARRAVLASRKSAAGLLASIRHDASRKKDEATSMIDISSASITHDVNRVLDEGSRGAEALLREIANQGPEKTLRRGFAVVRDSSDRPVTTASAALQQRAVALQFSDGQVSATIDREA
jgi:exodeoxyribonuclease VII large subunit